jgi:hypothetical protein
MRWKILRERKIACHHDSSHISNDNNKATT